MDRTLKAIYQITVQNYIAFSNTEKAIVIENILKDCEKDYIKNTKTENIIIIDPLDFRFLNDIDIIKNLHVIFSYLGKKIKTIDIDFSPIYRYELDSFVLLANPKIVFLNPFDCALQTKIKKLKANFLQIRNLDVLKGLKSLSINLCNEKLDLKFLENKSDLEYLVLEDGFSDSLDCIQNCSSLVSLTIKNHHLNSARGLETLTCLKNLYISGIIRDDIGKYLVGLKNLEYVYLGYNGKISSLEFLEQSYDVKVLIIYCKVENGDLTLCDRIPYVKVAVEYPNYNRKNTDLRKEIKTISLYDIPTYIAF